MTVSAAGRAGVRSDPDAPAPPPDRPAAPAGGGAVDPNDHLKWVKAIARGVRADYRFGRGSQEEFDLEQTAAMALCRAAVAFDVETMAARNGIAVADVELVGAFRGYASRYVRGECVREARRLRNGGTFHTRRERNADGSKKRRIEVESADARRTPDGDRVELPDPRTVAPAGPDPGPGLSPCVVEFLARTRGR